LKKQGGKSIIGRLGGDEFAIFLQNINEKEGGKAAEYICKTIENFSFSEEGIHSTISMGCTLYPEGGTTVKDLLKKSDISMYRAKKSGRNQYYFFSPKDHDLERSIQSLNGKNLFRKR
jgi:diguanylate cyclase (GGDEF)-like protein